MNKKDRVAPSPLDKAQSRPSFGPRANVQAKDDSFKHDSITESAPTSVI